MVTQLVGWLATTHDTHETKPKLKTNKPSKRNKTKQKTDEEVEEKSYYARLRAEQRERQLAEVR